MIVANIVHCITSKVADWSHLNPRKAELWRTLQYGFSSFYTVEISLMKKHPMSFQKVDKILASCTFFLPEGEWFNFKLTFLRGEVGMILCNCFITVQLLFSNWLMYKNTSDNRIVIYCGIIEFHGGLIFVDFVDTSHPRTKNLHEWIN